MISRTIIPLLSLATLFTSTSLAFPSRTHCLCTIVDASNQHFLPESLPTSEYTDATPVDVCTPLGPELENLRSEKPHLYADFISHALTTTSEDATSTEEERPLSTTVLLQLTARTGFGNLGVVLPSAPAGKSQQAIACRTKINSFSGYQGSLITLFVVQVIVGLAVLACVAECVTLALRRMSRSAQEHIPEKPALRLSGEEKRLMAIPPVETLMSPGVDKKLRLYRNGDWTPRLASGKKEFDAYVLEEDDDELSRPVM